MANYKHFEVETAREAAMRAFWRRGYDGTSMADLLAATGLGKGSLYATFGDKQALFISCLDRYGATVAAELLTALLSHPGSARAAVAAMYTTIVDRMADPSYPTGCLVTLSAAQCAVLPEDARSAVQHQLDGQLTVMTQVLRADPSILDRGADVEVLAAYLVGTAQTLALMHRAGTDVPTLRGIATTALGALDPAALGTTQTTATLTPR